MELTKRAPTGYEPCVLVYLVARDEPIEIGLVSTGGSSDGPWVRLEALNRDRATDSDVHPKDRWVHVRDNYVERVELRFVPTGNGHAGFRHEEEGETL